jgi:mono/diheme cytochrome c family protein
MGARLLATMALISISCSFTLATRAAAQAATLPEGVTPAMVKEGAGLFRGAGLCYACHGPDAKGDIGPNLTDATWLHSTGSYAEIVQQITTGVPAEQSKSGIMMPPKGASTITDAQVKAVAAYVWTLSQPR